MCTQAHTGRTSGFQGKRRASSLPPSSSAPSDSQATFFIKYPFFPPFSVHSSSFLFPFLLKKLLCLVGHKSWFCSVLSSLEAQQRRSLREAVTRELLDPRCSWSRRPKAQSQRGADEGTQPGGNLVKIQEA